MNFQSRRTRIYYIPELSDYCADSGCCESVACTAPTDGEGHRYCRGDSCFYNTTCMKSIPVDVMADDVTYLKPGDLAALHREVRRRAPSAEGAE